MQQGKIQTPCLLPVGNFIGGSTTNCGGLWKYLRQELFNTNLPLMSEIMQFLNFNISAKSLKKWREKTFHEWFENFKQPLFLDSGGFQLLNNKDFDIDRFGLAVAPKEILELQLDFGGDIIATLDYPIPPNLKDSEAAERIQFSIENTITTLRLLQAKGDEQTKVFVPIHGRSPEEISAYIYRFATRYNRSRLDRPYNGFAVGSLVPLRRNPEQIIAILAAAKRALTEKHLDNLPVHVFGVGSTLIPYLVYLGFDSFDSSTYVAKARNLHYSHPDTWANQRATQLEELTCQCSVCIQLDVAEMHSVLKSSDSFQKVNGRFKSEFYAYIAMHNLNLHIRELEQSIQAAKNGYLEKHLVEFTNKHIHQGKPLEALCNEFPELKKKLGRIVHAVVKRKPKEKHNISLKYKHTDFTIPKNYKVPKKERILLLFPCSKEKPYSTSQTYGRISAAVQENLNGTSKKIHFVVLSGLYGPVPLEYDSRPEVKNYDYVLTFRNHVGIELVGGRLAEYLKIHGERFDYIVAIAASKPYRKAILIGVEGFENAQVFPKHKLSASTGRTAQIQQGLEECMGFLKSLEA